MSFSLEKMKFSKLNMLCACVVGLVLIAPIHNAPRSRSKGHSSSTKYDQTQSGDYNVQVHLKDFHIIAVLGDDTWGGYGDYDYNYDYSDLTIKPTLPATTVSPQESTNTSGSSDLDLLKPEIDTAKPSDDPYSTVSPSTTHRPIENSVSTTSKLHLTTNAAPSGNTTTSSKEQAVISYSEKNVNSTTQKSNIQSNENPNKPSSVEKLHAPQKTTKLENSGEILEKKTESSVTNISIVPIENTGAVQNDPHLPLGEIMHYRKCAEGYARDKQGRCRKNRWTPQLPFGLSRFASNLASRFRHAAAGESS